jgi:glycosyltransferase involved in cell wall biosynthesis
MRIAITTPLFPRGGEPFRGWPIYKTIEALQRYADIRVISPMAIYPWQWWAGKSALWSNQEDALGVTPQYLTYPAFPLLTRPWNGAICARRLYRGLRDLRPDVVLAYWLYPEGYAAVKAAHALGIPAVVAARGSDLRWIPEPATRMMVRRTLCQADYVLTVSEELRERALQMGVAEEKALTILNGVEPRVFHPGDRRQAREALGLPPDGRIILYVGRLSKLKGLKELIWAFGVLAKERRDLWLACLGNGPFRTRLIAAAKDANCGDRLIAPGEQDRESVSEWMRAADLLCLPSYSEGCPNVVIEAAACHCPVVATEVGGTPEIVDAASGILIPSKDRAALLNALRDGLTRQWKLNGSGAISRRTWDDVARETSAVCERATRPASSGKRGPQSRPLKITLVTPYFPTSGLPYEGHSAFQTVRFLTRFAEVEVLRPITTHPGLMRPAVEECGPADLKDRLPGVKVTYLRYPSVPLLSRPVNGFLCERPLLPLLRASRPDVVLNYWIYPEGYAAVRAGARLGIPVVVGSIGSDLRHINDPFTQRFVRKTLVRAAAVITVSEELRQRALEFGVPAEKVVTILNGRDPAVFYPGERTAARRAVGYEHEGELILYVGRIVKSKGVGELIDAFAAIRRLRPGARLALIGEGNCEEALKSRAARLGVLGDILLPGPQPSRIVAEWMRAADLFCLPSYSEGCPNVLVEALSSGCPVVATNVGGIPELIHDHCGILVPPADHQSLSTALEKALSREWDRSRIAADAGRDWEEVAKEVFALCRQLVKQRTAKAAEALPA